jgi:hypothetical protein
MIIIISRYHENVDWTKNFPNVKIFNKGESLDGDFNQIYLDNVGREGHTYYKYIYDNYETLEDYTIFLQGNPFDRSPSIIDKLNYYINKKELDIDFEYLSNEIFPCDLSGCSWHGNLPLQDVYEKLFNERKMEMSFEFGAGAQFIVSKSRILKRPKEFYLKIVEMLQNEVSPIEGYVIERFHKLIFS